MITQVRTGLGFDLQKIELYRFMNYQTPVKFEFKAPNVVIFLLLQKNARFGFCPFGNQILL